MEAEIIDDVRDNIRKRGAEVTIKLRPSKPPELLTWLIEELTDPRRRSGPPPRRQVPKAPRGASPT